MKFDAVLFDWDGTLADTRQAILLSFRRALDKINVAVLDTLIERRIGIGADKTFREILQVKNRHFNDELIKTLVEEKISAEIELSGCVKLFPGVLELLNSLQGRLKIALASMNNRAVIDHFLQKLNISSLFDVVITVEDVSNFKPNPEIFLKCAYRLGIPPERCIVVEDSIFGVEAAKTAGMSCLAVLTGVYSRQELARADPDMIVSSLSDTAQLLRFLLG
jgi:beta-phosphoglucomutase